MWKGMVLSMDSVSYSMEVMSSIYDLFSIMGFTILFLIVWVYWFMIVNNSMLDMLNLDNMNIELVWTIIPIIIIIITAVISNKFLFMIDSVESANNYISLKVIGSQWYWTYFWGMGMNTLNLSSFFDSSYTGIMGMMSDSAVVIPSKIPIMLSLSSSDVIHSWSVNQLGVKVDCVPGRINFFLLESLMFGNFYGMCSEICGMNHSSMPINIKCVDYNTFCSWFFINSMFV